MIMMPYGGPGPSPQLTAQADFWHPTGIGSTPSPIEGIYRQSDLGCTLGTLSFTLCGTLKAHDGAGQTVSAASSPAVHRA